MRNTNLTSSSSPERKSKAFEDILTLAGDFFMKKGIVFETMQRLTERLESEGIPYAVIAMSTDYDCWKSDEEPVTWEAILEIFKQNVEKVTKLLISTIPKIK